MIETIPRTLESVSVNYKLRYEQLSKLIKNYASKLHLEQKEIQPLQENPQFNEFLNASSGAFAIMDFKLQSYVFMSDNTLEITGYPKEDFIRLGIAQAIALFPEDQNKTIVEKVLPLMFSFFEKHALEGNVDSLRVSYNTKVIKADGTCCWFLHQLRVLYTDENNLPHFGLKMITDITDIKKDDAIDFVVAKKNNSGRFENIYKETFITNQPKYVLTQRECQILHLMSDGCNSKTISEDLFISEHTVNNHRKNILKKLDAKNTVEGLRKAIAHGLI